MLSHWHAHRYHLATLAVGLVVALLVPGRHSGVGRCLIGWNASTWLYLLLTFWKLGHTNAAHLKAIAVSQAESAGVVVAAGALAAIASFVAVTLELSSVKSLGIARAWPHVVLALATVAGSWLLVPILFSLNYASIYHVTPGDDNGLNFPNEGKDFEPDLGDFLYFSFTMAVASQTSDVTISTRRMRRLALLQSVLSFGFNTTILALTINIAASLIGT